MPDAEFDEFEQLKQSFSTSQQQFLPVIYYNATLDEFERSYNLSCKLGIGGFSVVKRCTKISNGQEFAVKIVDKKKYRKRHNRLVQEIEVLSMLDHRNCIRLHEAYITQSNVLLVTDLVNGGELLDRIMQFGNFQETYTCYIIKQVLEGVEYLHSKGIVHRDLKLENILLESNSPLASIKIADFGLSKIVGDKQILSTICGSPQYVAPEILQSGAVQRPYTSQVDLWSIGVLMFIMLSGSPPFNTQYGDSAMFDKIKKGRYETSGPIWDRVSQEAKQFLSRLLTIDFDKRITASQALKQDWINKMSQKAGIDVSLLQLKPRANLQNGNGKYDLKVAHPEWTFACIKQNSSFNLSIGNEIAIQANHNYEINQNQHNQPQHNQYHAQKEKSAISNSSTLAPSHVTSRRSFYFDDQKLGFETDENRYSYSNLQYKSKVLHLSSSSFSEYSQLSCHSSMQDNNNVVNIENNDLQFRNTSSSGQLRKIQSSHSGQQRSNHKISQISINSQRSQSQMSDYSYTNHEHYSNNNNNINKNSNSSTTNNNNIGDSNVQQGMDGFMTSQEISNKIHVDRLSDATQDLTHVTQELTQASCAKEHPQDQFLQIQDPENSIHIQDTIVRINKQTSRDSREYTKKYSYEEDLSLPKPFSKEYSDHDPYLHHYLNKELKSHTSISQDSFQRVCSIEYDGIDLSNKTLESFPSSTLRLEGDGHRLNQENLGSLCVQDDLKGLQATKYKNFMEPSFTILEPQVSIKDLVSYQNELHPSAQKDQTRQHSLLVQEQPQEQNQQQVQQQQVQQQQVQQQQYIQQQLQQQQQQQQNINNKKLGLDDLQHSSQVRVQQVSQQMFQAPSQNISQLALDNNQTNTYIQPKNTVRGSFSISPKDGEKDGHTQIPNTSVTSQSINKQGIQQNLQKKLDVRSQNPSMSFVDQSNLFKTEQLDQGMREDVFSGDGDDDNTKQSTDLQSSSFSFFPYTQE